MNANDSNHTTDRWGHDDDRRDRDEPEGQASWLIIMLMLLLALAAGTGFMVYRARHLRQLAVVESALAEEARQRALARQAADQAAKESQDKTTKAATEKTAK